MTIRPRILRAIVRPEDGDDVTPGDNGEATLDAVVDPLDPDFDESTYLRAFPDIAEAVRRGALESGLAHFLQTGRAEARLEKAEYRALLDAYVVAMPPQVAIDTLTISPSGATLMTGWSDDRFDPLVAIDLQTSGGLRHDWSEFPRLVRADVERTLETGTAHHFGFLLVAAPARGTSVAASDARSANAPMFRFLSGVESRLPRDPVVASDADLRDLALAALPTAVAGELNPEVAYRILDQHVGTQIAAMNRLVADQARSRQLCERFGPKHGRYRGSVITMLRGGTDQIVPRLALTAAGPGTEDYEFIVIITNANQFESALRAARIAELTLGVSLTLILQPDGDPAYPGDEAVTSLARSDRLIFMDHTILPREPDWALRHSELLDGAPADQTRIMGGMLYGSDGSLINGGYYFDRETSLLTRSNNVPVRITAVALNKVSDLAARGSPVAQKVAGVPAAFLSIDRSWFETLGGFTGEYSRAVYEDIDLCLRSRKHGVPAWVHPLPMWHFERRPPPRPEPSRGGAILNDWLLHRRWDAMIGSELLGPTAASEAT